MVAVLDAITLLVRWFLPMAVGDVHSNGVARLRRDGASAWTLGRAEEGTYRSGDLGEVIGTVDGDATAAARAFAEAHPTAAKFIVDCERSRLAYAAECLARESVRAHAFRERSTRTTTALREAMASAGLTCLCLIEPYTEQGQWGETEGFVVYADSQAAADWVAAWLIAWSCRDTARTVQPFRGTKPAGIPFAAFAGLHYYSIGD